MDKGTSMTQVLRQIIAQNRAGRGGAIPSICSAHPAVIEAALLLAQELDTALVIEATSNQVNQDGGYTGMNASDFAAFVHGIAQSVGVDPQGIIFGGDHLGPQAWRSLPPAIAMDKARDLVVDYAKAGFGKLHLDCSEGCLGEPAQLPDALIAARSAELAAVALRAAPHPRDLMFVIGTEVPPPGGARADEDGDIAPTTPDAARATLAAHQQAFEAAGIGAAIGQIGGLVVQPGVEFSPQHIHHLPLARDPNLLAAVQDWPNICLEAHSTDYQNPAVFPRLAELGFAFQKVGPALTFAWRAALYALDDIRATLGARQGPSLPAVMEAEMMAAPHFWQGHYHAQAGDLYAQRHFGLADRIRYYWPKPKAEAAVQALFADLAAVSLPDTALLAHFTDAEVASARHMAQSLPRALALVHVQSALRPYFFLPQTS
jgi:D-tagatose-bisphosphate aldolase class II non-catalytic subunit